MDTTTSGGAFATPTTMSGLLSGYSDPVSASSGPSTVVAVGGGSANPGALTVGGAIPTTTTQPSTLVSQNSALTQPQDTPIKTPSVITPAITETKQNISDLTTAAKPTTSPGSYVYRKTNADGTSQVQFVNDPTINQAYVNSLLQSGYTFGGQQGNPSATDPMAQFNTPSTTTPTPTTSGTQPDLTTAKPDSQTQNYINQMTSLMSNSSAASASYISAIQQEYDQLAAMQQKANQAQQGGVSTEGIVSGRTRYAPEIQMGMFNAAVAQGAMALSGIRAKQAELISQAQLAQSKQQFDQLDSIMTAYRSSVKDERDLMQQTYQNAITASQEARAQAKSSLDISTQTAENFAPAILKATQGMTPDEQQAYINQFSASHNIDPATVSGQVQKYGDTINQSMKTAMYSLLSDHPDAGITMDDINGNNISTVASKVMGSASYGRSTLTQQADIREKLASAAINEAQARMISDPNSLTSLATYALTHNGSLPPGTNSLMVPVVLDTARKMAPSVLPKGSIIGADGLPSSTVSGSTQDKITAGNNMLNTINDIRSILDKHNVPQGLGAGTLQDIGQYIGSTSTDYSNLQQYIGLLSRDYDVLTGGVRGGASLGLIGLTQAMLPDANKPEQYNLSQLNSFEGGSTGKSGVIGYINGILNQNNVTLNKTVVKSFADQTSDITKLTQAGLQNKGTSDQIQTYLEQAGYSEPAIQAVFKANNLKYNGQ